MRTASVVAHRLTTSCVQIRASLYTSAMSQGALAFGPFLLDERSRTLRRDGLPVPVTHRLLRVLHYLASQRGMPVSKDTLVAACWGDVAVTDNSVEQAVSRLRRVLGTHSDSRSYIETVPRHGYRFTGDVRRVAIREGHEHLRTVLAPQRALLDGREALETLEYTQLEAADESFRHVLTLRPDDVLAHSGLANVCLFHYESTRVDERPDLPALLAARQYAEQACRLDPELAEAWATLATAHYSFGEQRPALEAARHAVTLEPNNWRHVIRLAWVSWGEARLRAAERALELVPNLALAHWFAATVHVARQAFVVAERHIDAGAVAQDAQREQGMRFGG